MVVPMLSQSISLDIASRSAATADQERLVDAGGCSVAASTEEGCQDCGGWCTWGGGSAQSMLDAVCSLDCTHSCGLSCGT